MSYVRMVTPYRAGRKAGGGGKPYQGQRKLIRLRKASGLGIGVAWRALCYIDFILYILVYTSSSSVLRAPSIQALRSRNARLSDLSPITFL